jgi:Tfp pilus assembly protein PilF
VLHLKTAVSQGHDDFFANYYLGSALLKTGDSATARRYLDRAVQQNPEHPGTHFQLASFHRAAGDKEAAAAEQKLFLELTARQEAKWRAESLELAAARAIQSGDLKQALSALSQAYDARPSASTASNLALAHLQDGNIAEARRLLEKALESSPGDAAALNYLGLLEARQGNLRSAGAYFERAAAATPPLADALYNAGVAAAANGAHDKASEYLRRALAVQDSPRTREALALVLSQSGKHEEAQREFDMAQRQQGVVSTSAK